MSKKQKYILIGILIVAASLRFYGLSRGDVINDEVFMAFRGLGMMDFDEASAQTTPWEWFDPITTNGQTAIPWWAHLSFHDHPLLVPYTQHLFMGALGESAWVFRLPSAILGIVSVYLVFLLGRELFSVNAGLIASAFLGLSLNNVYISRTGMQEPYVIFFLLLGSYLFLKSLKNDKYLRWVGAVFGLGLLAKYNVFILAPILITYLLFFKREYFKNKNLWIGAILAGIISSPIVIYNLMLYRTSGHFDFQLAYIFGQHPAVWQVEPGKNIGSLGTRIRNFLPWLAATNSWIFLILAAGAVIGFLTALAANFKSAWQKYRFLLISVFYLLILLMLIGPAYRFLTMLTPYLALGIGAFLNSLLGKFSATSVFLILAPILAFEIFYSFNNQIAYYPVGPTPWLASKVRYENYNWGYNQLGEFFDRELAGRMPAVTFDLRYKFLDDLRDKILQADSAANLELYPALIVYYGNFDDGGKLWTLGRLHIYHAWPVIDLQTYFDYLRQNGTDYYQRSGFKKIYFVVTGNVVPTPEAETLMQGSVTGILNPRGEAAFKVYQFDI